MLKTFVLFSEFFDQKVQKKSIYLEQKYFATLDHYNDILKERESACI